MIKNNLKSLLIHVTISIVSVFVFFFFNAAQVKWASEKAAIKHHYNMMFVAVIIIAVAVVIYYLFGKLYLINLGNIYKDLFSVSVTTILGIFFWTAAFSIDWTSQIYHLLNSQLWQYYSLYNGYSLFLLNESGNNNPYVFLLFSFIPSIAMWFGLVRKRSRVN